MVVIHKKKIETEEEKAARQAKMQEQAMGLQDEYQAKGFELVSFVQSHKFLVSLVILALFIGGAMVSAYFYYQQRHDEEASAQYISALKILENLSDENDQEKRQLVRDKLGEIIKNHPSSGVAAIASLYAGHLALEVNDQVAITHYQNALKMIKPSDPLYSLAVIGLAYAQDQAGQVAESLATFLLLVEKKDASGRDLAMWESARLAKKLGDKDKAKSIIDRLLEEFPNSTYEKNAKSFKASLQSNN